MSLPRPQTSDQARPKHPAGTFQVALADIVLLGKRITTDRKKGDRYPQERIVLLWQSLECLPDSSQRFDLATEFTWTLSERGNLRQFLAPWLGPFANDAVAEAALTGLDTQIGRNALATIVHNTARDGSGRVYVNIETIGPLMKGMPPFALAGYTRHPYWAKRTEQYAADYAAFLAGQQMAATPAQPVPPAISDPPRLGTTPSKAAELAYDAMPSALAEPEDDLPF